MTGKTLRLSIIVLAIAPAASGQVLEKRRILEAHGFWDNRDWDWYEAHIPFLETPDREIDLTWYYRWEILTKHLTYGSPDSGYTFTEFIDRPFWSGAYGAISCPAGHQLYEARWLRDPRIARDFARYWFRTPGAEPRRYSTWLADGVWALHRVHPDEEFAVDLLPDLVRNFQGWEKSHFVPEVGLFWQTGHDDGMEININSRQTRDKVRGAPAYRPTLNAYLWADARAIARIARLSGDEAAARAFEEKAKGLKERLQKLLWDPEREFFFPLSMRDEEDEGHVVKAMTLTYKSGRFAGSPYGRELIGYVPWQFGLPDAGFEAAWKFLMDRERFLADFGPTVTERKDPLFAISRTCCWWSGQSWPYATTQTLAGMANLLHDYRQEAVTRADYFRLLRTYALTHRKGSRPYIAEAAHPDTGSWEGHDSPNHSEHYFHSAFADLVITGLCGLRPRDDETVEVDPLAPAEWDHFALDAVPYRGRLISIIWDRKGDRHRLGAGLHVLAEGKKIASAPRLEKIVAVLPPAAPAARRPYTVNFAVNNDGKPYPRIAASHPGPAAAPLSALQDGNSWYHVFPPNRWTCEGSANERDWVEIDFGMARRIDAVKLYFLDDTTSPEGKEGALVRPPASYEVESWDGAAWKPIARQSRAPSVPAGRRANVVRFAPRDVTRLRVTVGLAPGARSGLSEIEAWGEATPPVPEPPPPAGNLARNPSGEGFPRVTASYTSRFDKAAMANDGITILKPTPHNRWTAFESPNAEDWLEIDFGEPKDVARLELFIYDDRGGVRAPERHRVETWDGSTWKEPAGAKMTPPAPTGRTRNTVTFERTRTQKVRIVFTHRGKARSGVSEVEAWGE